MTYWGCQWKQKLEPTPFARTRRSPGIVGIAGRPSSAQSNSHYRLSRLCCKWILIAQSSEHKTQDKVLYYFYLLEYS